MGYRFVTELLYRDVSSASQKDTRGWRCEAVSSWPGEFFWASDKCLLASLSRQCLSRLPTPLLNSSPLSVSISSSWLQSVYLTISKSSLMVLGFCTLVLPLWPDHFQPLALSLPSHPSGAQSFSHTLSHHFPARRLDLRLSVIDTQLTNAISHFNLFT